MSLERVPSLHHEVAGPLAGDDAAVEHARQSHGVVADVDGLLDLAQSLRGDLAHLERHKSAEVGLELAQLLADLADDLTALRSGELDGRESNRIAK